jgi:hypothetical protein
MIRTVLLALCTAALAIAQTAVTPGGAWGNGVEFQIAANGRWVHYAQSATGAAGAPFDAVFPIATAGLYDVQLAFEESTYNQPGARSINAWVDEAPAVQALDPFARFGFQTLGVRHALAWLEAGSHRVHFTTALAGRNALSSGVTVVPITLGSAGASLEFRTCTGAGKVGTTNYDCEGLQSVAITLPDGKTVLGPYMIIPVTWDSKWSKTAATYRLPVDDAIPGVVWPPYVFDAVFASACEGHRAPELTVNGNPRPFTRGAACNIFYVGSLAPGDAIALAWADPYLTARTMLSAIKASEWK